MATTAALDISFPATYDTCLGDTCPGDTCPAFLAMLHLSWHITQDWKSTKLSYQGIVGKSPSSDFHLGPFSKKESCAHFRCIRTLALALPQPLTLQVWFTTNKVPMTSVLPGPTGLRSWWAPQLPSPITSNGCWAHPGPPHSHRGRREISSAPHTTAKPRNTPVLVANGEPQSSPKPSGWWYKDIECITCQGSALSPKHKKPHDC